MFGDHRPRFPKSIFPWRFLGLSDVSVWDLVSEVRFFSLSFGNLAAWYELAPPVVFPSTAAFDYGWRCRSLFMDFLRVVSSFASAWVFYSESRRPLFTALRTFGAMSPTSAIRFDAGYSYLSPDYK